MTRRLVAHAAAESGAPEAAALAVHAACEGAYRELTRSLGSAGSHALITRALAQAGAEHPVLRGIHVARQPEPGLGGVSDAVQTHGIPAVAPDIMDLEIHGPVTAAQRVDLSRIRRNQRHVVGLINDLLNLTRVNSGQLEYNVRDIVAHELLAASVALVEPLIAQKQLTCELIACDSNIVLRGDPERVSQILVNLLSNGIKFTAPGGRLVIDCEAIGEVVLIRVSDTGIGIPLDKLDVIFAPFIQIRSAAVGVDAGLGLGLAISRRLARDMQGELTVESTLGEGTRFTLALPRSSAV